MLVTRHPYEWLDSVRRNAFYNNFHKGQVPFYALNSGLSKELLTVSCNTFESGRMG